MRINGLDTLRFICSLFVVIGHFGLPLPAIFNSKEIFSYHLIGTALNLIFNGPAAVIVFFIISGFCINLPNINKNKIILLPFYVRRMVRILLPALICILFYILLKIELKPPLFGTLWSIICEVIYYFLYPILFYIRKYIAWKYLILITFTIALILPLLNQDLLIIGQSSYVSLGLQTWIIGLPCWLMGCWLSENYLNFKLLSINKMWLLRILILLIVFLLRVIKFHVNSIYASNCFTLNFFSLIAVVWIGYEIAYFQNYKPNNVLEKLGLWSYSLYLVHPLSGGKISVIGFQRILNWNNSAVLLIISLLFSYIFYLLIEKPSHFLSKYLSKLVTKNNLKIIIK